MKTFKAIVKNIPDFTVICEDGKVDVFVMIDKIGKSIDVFKLKNRNEWFMDNDGFSYHKSWLEFVNNQTVTSTKVISGNNELTIILDIDTANKLVSLTDEISDVDMLELLYKIKDSIECI